MDIAIALLICVLLLTGGGTIWHFIKPPKPFVNTKMQAKRDAFLRSRKF